MIEEFTKAWFANLHKMREKFTAKHPKDYKEIVCSVVEMLSLSDGGYSWEKPDPERIHEIDDGDYQGTLVYVIAAQGYQPSQYWYLKIAYGTCSVCDTLKRINDFDSDSPNDDQVSQYMTLALHIIQGLREIGGEAV